MYKLEARKARMRTHVAHGLPRPAEPAEACRVRGCGLDGLGMRVQARTRHTPTQTHPQTHRDTQRHTETHRDTQRDTERHRDIQTHPHLPHVLHRLAC